MKKNRYSDQFLSKKRLKALLKRRRKRPHLRSTDDLEAKRPSKSTRIPYRSKVIDFYTGGVRNNQSRNMHATIKMPRVFSIIKNPSAAVAVYNKLATVARSPRLRSVTFDHSRVDYIDLAAERILGTLAREIEREQSDKRKRFALRGIFPNDDQLETYIRATGIVQALRIESELLPDYEAKKRRVMSAHHIGGSQGDQKVKLDNAVVRILDHVDNCLSDHDLALTTRGMNDLVKYCGEIILNIQEHTRRHDWVVAGYMDPTEDGHVFELAIFNFGMTIADTFNALPTDAAGRKVIDQYLGLHQKKNFFGASWETDDLITLLALQGHVSSKLTAESPDRGQGTIDLIEFFMKMHTSCAGSSCSSEMTIMSGSTCIRFDGTYTLEKDSTGRHTIAFNEGNDLSQPPDSSHIFNIKPQKFPGTVIAIQFPLEPLQEAKG